MRIFFPPPLPAPLAGCCPLPNIRAASSNPSRSLLHATAAASLLRRLERNRLLRGPKLPYNADAAPPAAHRRRGGPRCCWSGPAQINLAQRRPAAKNF